MTYEGTRRNRINYQVVQSTEKELGSLKVTEFGGLFVFVLCFLFVCFNRSDGERTVRLGSIKGGVPVVFVNSDSSLSL